MGLLELPPELCIMILTSLESEDLLSLSLVSRPFNRVATPILYRKINVEETGPRSFATLASSKTLGTFVSKFELPYHAIESTSDYKRDFTCAVEHMVHLQHFTCQIGKFLSPKVWAALSLCATLKSISVALDDLEKEDTRDLTLLNDLRPHLPNLTSVTIEVIRPRELPKELTQFLQHLIRIHAPQLHELSFVPTNSNPSLTQSLMSIAEAFPQMKTMSITPACLYLPAIAHTPEVHTLRVIPEQYSNPTKNTDPRPLAKSAFPKIVDLRCPPELLPYILCEGSGRPVRKVCLDEAWFDVEPDSVDSTGQSIWEDVYSALRFLPNSTGPVVDLSIWAGCDVLLEQEHGLKDTVAWLGSLKKLTICCGDDAMESLKCCHHLGRTFFQHLPNLHTFLLSDGPALWEDPDEFFHWAFDVRKQRSVLTAWKKGCPQLALRTVAFSLRYIWRKQGNKWIHNVHRRTNDEMWDLKDEVEDSEDPECVPNPLEDQE